MKNNLKPKFRCTFKVFMTSKYREIHAMWFAATTKEAARKQARKYLKETYGNNFEILSISY